jgi:hypothetical protein
MHGGTQLTGIVSPHWKHGRWARSIHNARLKSNFYSALSDKNLISIHSDIALLDAMLAEQLEGLKAGKPMTERQQKRIESIMGQRRLAVEAAARMEQRAGKWVPEQKFGAYVDLTNALFVKVCVRPDGSPDRDRLAMVHRAIEQATLSVRQSDDIVEGEIVDDE